jgi:AcrR family transcriptional regulator
LKACALALFAERGFGGVTAAEIAAAAGMTERTFFRHFKAKEDVLFEDYSGIGEALVAAVADAPDGSSPRALMQAVAELMQSRLEAHRDEQRIFAEVVAREPQLRARALLRDQQWAEAISEGFRRRGHSKPRAALLAAATATTFRIVFDQWLSDRAKTKLATRFAAAVSELSDALE